MDPKVQEILAKLAAGLQAALDAVSALGPMLGTAGAGEAAAEDDPAMAEITKAEAELEEKKAAYAKAKKEQNDSEATAAKLATDAGELENEATNGSSSAEEQLEGQLPKEVKENIAAVAKMATAQTARRATLEKNAAKATDVQLIAKTLSGIGALVAAQTKQIATIETAMSNLLGAMGLADQIEEMAAAGETAVQAAAAKTAGGAATGSMDEIKAIFAQVIQDATGTTKKKDNERGWPDVATARKSLTEGIGALAGGQSVRVR